MKIIIKNIAFLLSMLLILQSTVIAAQTSDVSENTAVNTKGYNILNFFGFMDKSITELKPDDTLTRAQYASIVGAIMGFSDIKLDSETDYCFIDVKKDYWCSSQIYMLKNLGIISGINYYQFKPEDKITYAQAVKVIVTALGYDVQAEAQYGGYPVGYMTVANSLHILGKYGLESDSPITMQAATDMLYKALGVDIQKESSFGKKTEYNSKNGITLLSEYHDIYYDKGIVTDNGITALDGNSSVSKKHVMINGNTLNDDSNKAIKFLGHYVEYYYKDMSDEKDLLYIGVLENKENTLVIKADQLDTNDSEFSLTNMVYYEGDKKENAEINEFADLIYNNKAFREFGIADYKIKTGVITLIDNNGDNSYDVILVEEYHNIFVLSVDAVDKKIYGKIGGNIDLNDYKNINIFDLSGKDLKIEAIKQNNVISYAQSMDKSQITIYVSRQTAEGTVDEITENSDILKSEYVIGAKAYTMSADFAEALNTKNTEAEKPLINNAYVLYLDKDGKIAAVVKLITTDIQYAYLSGISLGKTIKLANIAEVRLYMPNGSIFDAYTAKKIKINDKEGCTGKDLYDDSRMHNATGGIKYQLVKVRLNSLGDIVEFCFANETPSEFGYNPNVFSLNKSTANSTYKGSNQRCFDGRYSISDKTLIFSVPAANDEFDIDDVEIIKPTSLVDGKTYNISMYDSDPTLVAKVAVIEAGGGSYEQALLTVDKVTSTINKDGQSVKKIYGVAYGAYVGYTEKKPGIIPDNVKQGDVARYSFNGTELKTYQHLISLADKPAPSITPLEGSSIVGGAFITIFGYLYSKSDTAISTINPVGSADKLSAHVLNGGAVKVTIYNAKDETVKVGSLAEVVQNSVPNNEGKLEITDDSIMVYLYRRLDYVRELVVVKY